jgi:hypothetical protein
MKRSAVFLVHLVQDINILRPLVFMAARDYGFETLFLVSTKFSARDELGIWQSELQQISVETGAQVEFFDTDWEAHRHLDGQGLLFTASESHLHNHVTTHSVFRHAPPTYLKVTLQHGFECVGFRHSAEHVRAHGKTASFGADIICAWSDSERLISLARSQLGKLFVTGPTSVLQMPGGSVDRKAGAPGLVCENLHSVRFQGVAKAQFLDAFSKFARLMARQKKRVTLRPHAGGQYFLKAKLELPPNVDIENAPLYRLDLRQFSYGISAPSSVLIDMLLADVPTAVWRSQNRDIDTDSFDGLTAVSSPREWAEFARAAERDRDGIVERQRRFLDQQAMPLDPRDVFSRFAQIFQASKRMEVRPIGAVAERERILVVANGNLPTVQLSFEKPLAPLVRRGEVAMQLLTEPELRSAEKDQEVERYLDRYGPSTIVFCRYSGPSYEPIIAWAKRERVPIVYHIDDDLLGIPEAIGARKFAIHNAPERLESVTALLHVADLVYASTEQLKQRLLSQFPKLPTVVGEIYCASTVLRTARAGNSCKVGYMASADHAHNLEPVIPAIERLLDRNAHVQFEFFGSIPVPEKLTRFRDRIVTTDRIADYDEFLEAFVSRQWDVGICPLAPIDFNLTKANTKWVEYTAAAAAVVATRGTVYDESCADGCGLLVETAEEWFSALDLLVNNVDERLAIVGRAQVKLRQQYNIARLRNQVLEVLGQAKQAVRARGTGDRTERKARI